MNTATGRPSALALNRSGSDVAVAIGTTIHVTRTMNRARPSPWREREGVNDGILIFTGDSDSTLISAS